MSSYTKESVHKANEYLCTTESVCPSFDSDGDYEIEGSFGSSSYLSPENITELYQAIQLLEFENEH